MTKTVQFSDRAYATLAALKRAGDSFSDVVERLAASGKDTSRLLELGPADADAHEFNASAARRDAESLEEVVAVARRPRPRGASG